MGCASSAYALAERRQGREDTIEREAIVEEHIV